MPSELESNLLPLLAEAEARFRELGDGPLWSSYESGIAIADFISTASKAIQVDTIDYETKKKLWLIFAPTSDWDDGVGEPNLGNAIFEILNSIYRPL